MKPLSLATLAAVGVVVALRLVAVDAAETPTFESLQREVRSLRAQNEALLRENTQLKAKLAEAEPVDARQEDKPKNRIRLPSNVTIDHNPR